MKETKKKSESKKAAPKKVEDEKTKKERLKEEKKAEKKAERAEKKANKKAIKDSRIKLHKSFQRSYREDYVRDLKAPGLVAHAMNTFKMIFHNWRIFLPLILLIVGLNIIFVGLLSEETYVNFQNAIEETNESVATGNIGNVGKAALTLVGTISTGGLNNGMSEVQQALVVLFYLIVWLVTIYLVRHLLAGQKPKMRDGLYNALTPLVSTFCVLAVILVEAIPIFVVIVAYSAAVSTNFLATPFYALVFFIFAALLLLLSIYLISSSFLALIAVSAPGLYPMAAINTATDLVAGRRVRLLIRILFAFVALAICWIITMMPMIILDNWLKSQVDWLVNIPIIPFCLSFMTLFSFIYLSAYSYLYYRQLLDYNDK